MTDAQVTVALVHWIASITGKTVIQSYQGGDDPALPYIMVNPTGVAEVRKWAQEDVYTDTGVPNGEGKTKILATPVIEVEFRFSVHSYGPSPTDVLRPIRTAFHLTQMNEPLMPGLIPHEISQIRDVPDWINNRWEPRAQMDVFLRGLVKDGFVIDTIEEYSFEFIRG
ncbi:hypothetical protein HQ945_08365 [Phyllobacterium sp. BT25]|uniref:Phage neck terminator protein gp12-like domain-containing protein n=1 Tax=Phyllobacterium pellucidum TaxID=2740464 RepID=A0A849VT44_9HYPH|nr:hypothetical protein [Phyllobacterium pellucidum]NTS31267.1 hypothetical protein [Phyllobacterium pellucidum]